MEYKILNKDNILEYIKTVEEIRNYFSPDDLYIDEIGDGNLNFVFIIKSLKNPKKALILKQAVPYLRCLGEGFPLNRKRMNFEIRALSNFSKNTPNYIPKLYETSEDMSCVVMQYLGDHIIMRNGLIDKNVYPNFSEDISTFLATNLFKNSSLSLNSKEKRELMDKFNSNSELCGLTEDFVFTFPFMEHPTNDPYSKEHELAQELFSDMKFKKAVLELKYKFMNQSDTLLHGDLHTGSIMLNEEETFVIDPEFSFIGPFGFDIGALIANLIMSYTSHVALETKDEYKQWLLLTIEEVLQKFEEKFLSLWKEQGQSALITTGFIDEIEFNEYKKEFMTKIFQDSLGFAGCKMSRRMFGAAGVADIRDIQDEVKKDKAIKMTLDIAKVLVKDREKFTEIKTLIEIIKDKTK